MESTSSVVRQKMESFRINLDFINLTLLIIRSFTENSSTSRSVVPFQKLGLATPWATYQPTKVCSSWEEETMPCAKPQAHLS